MSHFDVLVQSKPIWLHVMHFIYLSVICCVLSLISAATVQRPVLPLGMVLQ